MNLITILKKSIIGTNVLMVPEMLPQVLPVLQVLMAQEVELVVKENLQMTVQKAKNPTAMPTTAPPLPY